MGAGRSLALTTVRVPHGQPRPPDAEFRKAIAQDRQRLGLPPLDRTAEVVVAGPYRILVDGQEWDEYVAWDV